MFCFVLSIFVSSLVTAQSNDYIQSLSSDQRWLALLQYESSVFGAKKSVVRSANFFLSPAGNVDPSEEMRATLYAFNQPASENPNVHAQCRFPARLRWLTKHFPDEARRWPKLTCPDYLAFSYGGRIESVSLVFATGYLSNPASYFGHPLIKFNLSREHMPSSLLDVSVNYGALTPQNENGFIYVFKGLFGGYQATFSHRHFHYNNHAYGEVELRDMWEYRLNLRPKEVQFFFEHSWELLGQHFPYYFFSQNCASAAAKLLEYATGMSVMPRYLPYAIPYTLFDNLISATREDGTPLVASVSLIPSRQTRLTSRFKALNASQRQVVRDLVDEASNATRIQQLPIEQRAATIETLFDYISFQAVSGNQNLAELKRDLMSQRLELPPSSEKAPTRYGMPPPHTGPKPFLTRVGGLSSHTHKKGIEVQLRTSYYDLLSLDFGRPKNSEVRTLDLTVDLFEDFIRLRRLDLISVSTLNLSQTGLKGDGGWAWSFAMGFETLDLACKSCDLFKIEAGYGKAVTLGERVVAFATADVRAQTPSRAEAQLAVTPKIGSLINWDHSGRVKTELSLGYRRYIEDTKANATMINTETMIAINRDWDLRLAYVEHVDRLYRASISRYW